MARFLFHCDELVNSIAFRKAKIAISFGLFSAIG